jgi:hypothetical protein
VWFGGKVSTSQLVSVVLLAVAVLLYVRRRASPAVAPR